MKLEEYKTELQHRELTENTIKKYLREIKLLGEYANGEEVTQPLIIEYKKKLLDKFKISTANVKLTIINNYLKFLDPETKINVKLEREQKTNIMDNVLSQTDFNRLIRMSETRNKPRTKIIMLGLYYTGVRVSELEALTVEALKKGYMDINNKGKTRRVPIIKKLAKELKKYVKEENIISGPIIINRSGDPLSRSYIFKELKWIAGQARVKKDKVYPHSFRHLFAKQYLSVNNNNMLALADILGHSSLETTRIYTTLTTAEQRASISF